MKISLRIIVSMMVLLISFGSAQNKLISPIGKFIEYKTIDNKILVTTDNGKIEISQYASNIIRVRAVKNDFSRNFSYAVIQKPEGKFEEVKDEKDKLTLKTETLSLVVLKNPLRLQFFNKEGKLLNEDYKNFGITWHGNEAASHKKMFKDEKFIGLGEKTGQLDKRGNSYTNWNTDHFNYEIDADPIYKSIPFYIGLHDRLSYGIFFDNSFKTTFNFGASTDDEYMFFSAEEGELNYYFFGGSSVTEIIKDYTYLTGRMKMPPLWSLGYQQCRWSYFPDSEVLDIAKTFRHKNIPADVIYLDINYMDAYKIFTWHPEGFSKPKETIDKLKEMGFHVVVIVDPGIKVEKNYFASDEGTKNNYFVKYPDGKNYVGSVWPGRCNFPDFTDPIVRSWWGKCFSKLIEPGVEGFWNDMNEPAAWGQSFPKLVEMNFDGEKSTMKEGHNIYGMQMARSTFEGTKDLLKGKRTFVITRAAYAGVQRYSSVWTGDNVPSDEHMMLASRLISGLGFSGVPFVGADIGGFGGNTRPELFARWLSIGAFTPFFRTHSMINTNDREPWSFGEEIEEMAKNIISQRYKLLPYIYSSFYESTVTGLPIAKSLVLDYTFDEKVFYWDYNQEFLLGDNILVAPVESNVKICKLYLPNGKWYRMSSDELFEGNKEILAEAPLNDLPVFIKAGGIIPMQSVIQSTSEKPSDVLNLHVYYGDNGSSFKYYEDDGATYEYEKGIFYKRIISFSPEKKEIRLTPVEGSFDSKFNKINLVLHNFINIKQLNIAGKKIDLKEMNGKIKTKEAVIDNNKSEIIIKW
jgi:alpha-glucosidase